MISMVDLKIQHHSLKAGFDSKLANVLEKNQFFRWPSVQQDDGGMVTTNDDEIAEKINILRNHGSAARYHHDVSGYNTIPLHKQNVFMKHNAGICLPVFEKVASECLSLPIFPKIQGNQLTTITSAISSVF